MTQPAPRGSADFEALYDLPDPGPYYRGLAPSGYAMPERVAAAVRDLAAGRNRFTLLDFACGYGAVGLMLRRRFTMADLYAQHAGEGAARPQQSASRRRPNGGWRIGGLDVAGRALAYARHAGALDAAFCEDVLSAPPSPALAAFLQEVDLIVESGAIGGLLAPALPTLIEAAAPNRPAILFCARPNVDPTPIAEALATVGYGVAPLGAPVAYRKPLSQAERRSVAQAGAALGLAPSEVFDADGFMRVQMRLARGW